jgi:hypothetical protein
MTKVLPPGNDQPVDLVPDRGEQVTIRFEPLVRCRTPGCETLLEPCAGVCDYCTGRNNSATRKRQAKEQGLG